MGIPHLITHLRPYASTIDVKGETVVIDGPGFAYHIFHICLGFQPNARNPFEAAPSYQVIGETAIKWLKELESYGAEVKCIYFDGFLPAAKAQTRVSRLQNYTKQLNTYYEAWPQVIPSSNGKNGPQIKRSSMFQFSHSAPIASKIPALPFLVPAVIEALMESSRFQSITAVVPGEADLYCARFVKAHGGVIFTGDSDLLVHDIGPHGSVAFFRDLEVVSLTDVRSLKCSQFQIGVINERLELPKSHGMQALAFEMKMDPHASFPTLLQRAKILQTVKKEAALFTEFVSEYCSLPVEVARPEDLLLKPLQDLLKALDPRISEYVLQFSRAASAARLIGADNADKPGDDATSVNVFLPFLLDCPQKTSAWEMSTAVRQLAYGLMNLIVPSQQKISAVSEHRRQQNSYRGREWGLPNLEQIATAVTSLTELLVKIRERLPNSSEVQVCKTFAYYQDFAFANDNDRQPLGSTLLPKGSQKDMPRRLTWNAVHFSAQVQASYYSLRMLKQILQVVLACDNRPDSALPHRKLLKTLEALPKLKDLTGCYGDISDEEAERQMVAVAKQIFYSQLAAESGEDTTESTKPATAKSRKKNKRKLREQPQSPQAVTRKLSNPFELLEQSED